MYHFYNDWKPSINFIARKHNVNLRFIGGEA